IYVNYLHNFLAHLFATSSAPCVHPNGDIYCHTLTSLENSYFYRKSEANSKKHFYSLGLHRFNVYIFSG
ncbi:MAG TPA: hypothetical protein PLX87_07160, partial [Bacteroidales bacterium]|nr:hypothetical protein [Bacteroidales bacterium]HPP92536.1 hypothetical protein [Bacteroidales bacterium]HQG56822.1 hypothetical protein [Bacteroidales bacterium]